MPLDPATIDRTLAEYRRLGDCALVLPAALTDVFRNGPAYRVGVAHLLLKRRFLLADPTGVGKTVETLIAFAKLKERDPTRHALVLTTLSAVEQWQDEARLFLRGVTTMVAGLGPDGRSLPPAARQQQYAARPDILITTYDTAVRDLDAILHWRFAEGLCLVADEAQALKGLTQKKRRPAFLKMNRVADYVWGLSATPMSKDLWELFSVIDALAPGYLGSERAFAKTYMERVWIRFPGTRFGKWHIKRYTNEAQLGDILRTIALARPVEVFSSTLPAVVVQKPTVPQDADHRRLYRSILNEYSKTAGRMSGIQKAHAVMRAQQANDAPVLAKGGDALKDPYPAKFRELLRLLRENFVGQQVIVFSRYRTVADWLADTLAAEGFDTSRITGAVPRGARERIRQTFVHQHDTPSSGATTGPEDVRESGAVSAKILVLTTAGREALNLPTVRVVVFYNIPYGAIDVVQVIGRARRVSSTHRTLLVLFLCHAQTTDTATLRIVTTRLNDAKTINDAYTTATTEATTHTDTRTDTHTEAPTETPTSTTDKNTGFGSLSVQIKEGTEDESTDGDQVDPSETTLAAQIFDEVVGDTTAPPLVEDAAAPTPTS